MANMWKYEIIRKIGITYRIAAPSKESQVTVVGNKHA